MTNLIPIQPELRQELPVVIGNVDYTTFRETLKHMEEIIELAGLDEVVMRHVLKVTEEERKRKAAEQGKVFKELSPKQQIRIQKISRQALRYGIAQHLSGDAYRIFSCRLADSPLLQHFCLIDCIDRIKVPSKSTLQRYNEMIPESLIRKVVQELTMAASEPTSSDKEEQRLKLKEAINLDDYFADTTCVEANIHFPVDWVLLRDTTRTLMKSVKIIRREGLKNRMQEPYEFIRQINKLSMQMTQTRRQKGGKKKRKLILRLMKKLLKKIFRHAEKHMDLLRNHWQETELKEGQVKQIIKRMEEVLEKLPGAIHQAHERIIGERKVKNKDKILSLYDPDIHVIVRGKASAETEFGNGLFLGEQADGVILDWKLYKEQPPADTELLRESLERIKEDYNGYKPKSATTDRGFYSRVNQMYLEEAGIEDYMCPRSPEELQERLSEAGFCEHQKRRAQTEGRIGILRNNFLGKPLRSKKFVSRELNVTWCILAHNLWVIARLPRADQAERREAA